MALPEGRQNKHDGRQEEGYTWKEEGKWEQAV
jgi:hypothetical protein